MVSLDPNSRLSIDEILNHPWLTEGEISNPEQIRHEFKKRNRQVQEEVRSEAASKKVEKAAMSKNKAYRSGNEVDDETGALKPLKELE